MTPNRLLNDPLNPIICDGITYIAYRLFLCLRIFAFCIDMGAYLDLIRSLQFNNRSLAVQAEEELGRKWEKWKWKKDNMHKCRVGPLLYAFCFSLTLLLSVLHDGHCVAFNSFFYH